MGKRGLSFDEKRIALRDKLQSSGSFFDMKELEALARKIGVIPQAVPEVIEALVSEHVVMNDKVGVKQLYVCSVQESFN